ncbi:MAG: Aminodeoxychorismate synthase [Pseudomonadota bacterium]|nr:Aminodeoxychorismate synthase [Pseudomonadota bacterium]
MLHYRVLPFIDPELIFINISHLPGLIFLDSSQDHNHYGRYSFILLNPLKKYSALNDNQCIYDDLIKWHEVIKANQTQYDETLPPFTGGLAGYFSYDLSKQLERIPSFYKSDFSDFVDKDINSQLSNHVNDYYLGLYNQVVAFDHQAQLCYLMVTKIVGYDYIDYLQQLEELNDYYNQAKNNQSKPVQAGLINSINLQSNFSQQKYMTVVKQAQEYILNGDIFEVNLSQQFSSKVSKNYPFDLLYRKLRKINCAPFSAYLNLNELKIMSASPERFLSIRGRHIEARPIKGTCRRSDDPVQDHKLADSLQRSAKDRAENIMIVDLMRNDLAKICTPQSIKVSQLCAVESFTNIHHLVSVIEGDLKPENSIFEVIPACFPGGSITGAPKVRAMQVIEELEGGAQRGVYCGSIGYFGFNGNVDLSIAIRTLVGNNDELSFNVGGAITLYSDAEAEYNETLLKGQKLIEALL